MKEIDYGMLRKRREKILKRRAETNEQQHIGIGYDMIVDGRHYPVMACFCVDDSIDSAESKFKYLINGQKS